MRPLDLAPVLPLNVSSGLGGEHGLQRLAGFTQGLWTSRLCASPLGATSGAFVPLSRQLQLSSGQSFKRTPSCLTIKAGRTRQPRTWKEQGSFLHTESVSVIQF